MIIIIYLFIPKHYFCNLPPLPHLSPSPYPPSLSEGKECMIQNFLIFPKYILMFLMLMNHSTD